MKYILLALLTAPLLTDAQAPHPVPKDSARLLQEVLVRAYEQNKQLKAVSAAVSLIRKDQLDRFGNTSILPALNSEPGIHMEERSPGSYRLNIRGSTLRSPFGVRNVKIYWNDIPFTDPGGNTYLNQLSFFNMRSIEVIKGPAGSLYGAGTGGTLLIGSLPDEWQPGAQADYVHGSYHTNSFHGELRFGDSAHQNLFNYTHQAGDGYRNHTNMRRDIATWHTRLRTGDKQELTASFLYGDLYYQTPGGLNLKEYNTDPRQSRPAVGVQPSAEQAQAAIYQKMFLAGITDHYAFGRHWQNRTTVYGAYTQVKNPTFRNYEKRDEPHFGGRTVFTYDDHIFTTGFRFIAGAEAQKGLFNTRDFGNVGGRPDTLQTDDDVNNWTWTAFAQAELDFTQNWTLTAGASLNRSSITITRLSVPGFTPQSRTYSNEWAPRLALSKKLTKNILAYASVSKGFSPPTEAEVLPSNGMISTNLNAEHGLDYEAGLKSSWLQSRLYVEVNAFWYQLQQAIVQRKDSTNADYFLNAGSTRQKGIESQFTWLLLPHPTGALADARVWASYTWDHFRYHDFKQENADYSGRQLPSVAPNTVAAGADLRLQMGLYANLTYYYSDPIALDDANTVFASSYNLLGGRLGFRKPFAHRLRADLFVGVDNLFNTRYSLGNDLNAFGGRYYNAAPGINYYGGVSLQYLFKTK